MFLSYWMVTVLILAFGLCSYESFKRGYKGGHLEGVSSGVSTILNELFSDGVIVINKQGKIAPGKSRKLNHTIKVVNAEEHGTD